MAPEFRRLASALTRFWPRELLSMVRVALDAGYRHVDTAQVNGNEAEVGRAIVESGMSREDVFITTKLNPQHHGYVSTSKELEEKLEETPNLVRRPLPSALAIAG